MAVSGSAVTQNDIVVPDPNQPFIVNGVINPVWLRFLMDLAQQSNDVKALSNAILTEVNTQHP